VADLVREHAGELVVVSRTGQEPGEHEHVAPRDREGVQLRTLHDVKAVLELLRAEHGDQPPPDVLDVLSHRGILDQRKLRADLEEEAPTEICLAAPGAERPAAHRERRREREGDHLRPPPPPHDGPSPRATSAAK
jgi:hypothetical protein